VNGRQNSVLRRFVDDGWDYLSSQKPGPHTHKLHPQINPGAVHHDEEKKDINGCAVSSVDGSSVRSLDHKNQQTPISASDSDSRDHGLATPRIGSTLAGGSSNSNNCKDSGSGRYDMIPFCAASSSIVQPCKMLGKAEILVMVFVVVVLRSRFKG